MIQQRTTQAELETQRLQVRELTQARKQLQGEVTMLQQQIETVRNEASSPFFSLFSDFDLPSDVLLIAAKRQLQKRLQEDEISSSTSSAAQSGERTRMVCRNRLLIPFCRVAHCNRVVQGQRTIVSRTP